MKRQKFFLSVKSMCLIAIALVLATTQIAQAQPGNGQVWERYEDNPVVLLMGDNGTWNDNFQNNVRQGGYPVYDGEIWRYYHGGYSGATWGIGLWTAENIEGPWVECDDNPIMIEGGGGAWNESGIGCPMVIIDGDTLKMWFCGTDDNNMYQIGYASSTDGVDWTEYEDNPVHTRSGDPWDAVGIFLPSVIKNEDQYHMWYTGGGGGGQRIGYASSENGINWTPSEDNPVVNVGNFGEWNQTVVGAPYVRLDDDLFRMWFIGYRTVWQTGFATSDDGENWTMDPNNPVFPNGDTGEWDFLYASARGIYLLDDVWTMLYYGVTPATNTMGLGVATFVGHKPADFDLASPMDESILDEDTVTVSWYSSSDVDEGDVISYIVECSLSSRFREGETFADTTLDTFYVLTDVPEELTALGGELDELPDDETIYWRVRAIDNTDLFTWGNGDDNGSSFDIYIPDPPSTFNLLTPMNGSRLERTTAMFSWGASDDPDPQSQPAYDLWLDTLSDLSTAAQIADSVFPTEFTLRQLELNNDFYWTVRATDSNTPGMWANDTFHFHTHEDAVDFELFTGIPSEYSIASAYPNPFNPTLAVTIGLPESSIMNVRIFNIIGEQVEVLGEGEYTPDYHRFVFNATGYPTGIYFIHAEVPGKMNEVRKIVLMK
ncbi:T9SS type A sorting domain-containing protein [Calditrichota bacterium]